MNYTTIRKLIISNILVCGLLIFSGMIFGMNKKLRISDNLVDPQNGLCKSTDGGYRPIKPDGNTNENVCINRSDNGDIVIRENDQEDTHIATGNLFRASIVKPGTIHMNGVFDSNCYLKVNQQYKPTEDEHGNPEPNSSKYQYIESFFVRADFTNEQFDNVSKLRFFGQPSSVVCVFDAGYNSYEIYGFYANFISQKNLYKYCSSSRNCTSILAHADSTQTIINMPTDGNNQVGTIDNPYMAIMVQQLFSPFCIELEQNTIGSIETFIDSGQFKELKKILSNEQPGESVCARDAFGNWYQITSAISKNKGTIYTQFIKYYFIEISFAVIVAAFFLYVNGLGVK